MDPIKQHLFIRTDADTRLGIGHLVRCLALSQAWQEKGGRSTFILTNTAESFASAITGKDIQTRYLTVRPGSKTDALKTIKWAKRNGARWVVIDGYHFDAAYQEDIKASGLALLFIDDFGHAASYSADIVLNQNIYADQSLYVNKKEYTRLLLGPRYCLLRRQFWKRPFTERKTIDRANRILVTLGGGDCHNVTLQVANAIKRITALDLKVKVVVGHANPHFKSLTNTTKKSKVKIQLLKSVDNMAEIMNWADLAVSGGGSTCWEMACMGLPAILLTLFDNQFQISERLDRAGIMVHLGWYKDLSEKKIQKSIEQLLNSSHKRKVMSTRGMQIVDGFGSTRVVEAILTK